MTQLKAKKSLGQHWLNDPDSLKAVVKAAELNITDTVLEIGPGQASLTKYLIGQAAKVVAVEVDKDLVKRLEKLNIPNLEVISQDILKFDFNQLDKNYKLVANIPYYLTGNLIQKISEATNPPSLAVLLVQKAVAEKLAAKPGNASILSITAQYFWDVSLDKVVKAQLFEPPPKVDSQIVVLRRRVLLYPDIDLNDLFKIVKTGFSQRRKTLANSLSAGLQIDKAKIIESFQQVDIKPTTRAQNLNLEDWYKLYKVLT